MTSKAIYYCVYRITNLVEKKHYYGYKSSKTHPSKIIGVSYFSSLTKEEGRVFIKSQKENPQNYKYKIVRIFDNKYDALDLEIFLHAKFDVENNNRFYNKRNQNHPDSIIQVINTQKKLKQKYLPLKRYTNI